MSRRSITVAIDEKGRARIDIDLPSGPDCDRAQRQVVSVMALLGVKQDDFVDVDDDPGFGTAVPDGQRDKLKN